jgi:hypothetical protein
MEGKQALPRYYRLWRPCRRAKSGRRRARPCGGRRQRRASTPPPAPASRCPACAGSPARCGHARGLGDEEAAPGGALRVVDGGVRLRHVAVGAEPRHRREHHPVGELELPHPERSHQRDRLLRRLLLRHFAARERARCSLSAAGFVPLPRGEGVHEYLYVPEWRTTGDGVVALDLPAV